MFKMFKKVVLVSAVVCAAGIVFLMGESERCDDVTYSSSGSLEKILDIEEIHMMSYPYKGVAEKSVTEVKKNGKKKNKKLYKVTYDGHATIGTKEKIAAKVNKEEKKISIHIPEPKIIDTSVDFDSIDYIFNKHKYETETVASDSYKLCKEDMKNKSEVDKGILNKAMENTKNLASGLVKPMYPEYEIDFE